MKPNIILQPIFILVLSLYSFTTTLALSPYYPNFLYQNWFETLLLFAFLYASFLLSNKFFYLVTSVIFLPALLYLPQIILYGGLTIGVVASLHETNSAESIEYLRSIPYSIYIYCFLYIVLFLTLIILSKKTAKPKVSLSIFILLWGLILGSAFDTPIKKYNKVSFPVALESSPFYPIAFTTKAINLKNAYQKEKSEFDQALKQPDSWEIISTNAKYKNYVLIIGESMRKDYMSAYGYPIKTTPFLDKVNGIVFNDYVAASGNTQLSLKNTLYRKQDRETFIYTDNIISLANKANFKTYWLSNQGMFGQYDTIASRIGQQANYFFFSKKGSYDDKNYFDTVLLEPFKKALTEQTEQGKLIVLHLIGSHPLFCERLEKQPSEKRFSKEVNCYIETIKQTDHFIATINEILKQNNQSYSVLYFSDHGLSHFKDKSTLTLTVGNKYKQNYEVPLIKFSSDDVKREYIQAPKSAFHFMGGFAQWLGIQEKHLQQEQNFFSEETTLPIKVFNWQKFVNFEDLDSDPAITNIKKEINYE
ncbi:phosphoethanolamine transferase [Haemophilus haemoglobinophilus]|nr:phosphoethanolamine transferase [Canicola haemoglobinophilus]